MSGNLSREQKSEILSYINNPGKEGWKLEAEDDMEIENDADPESPGMSI